MSFSSSIKVHIHLALKTIIIAKGKRQDIRRILVVQEGPM